MRKFICSICGYLYDEAVGDPDRGIAPGTKWEDVPEDWTCPICGAVKTDFAEQETSKAVQTSIFKEPELMEMQELSQGELSALFSNLSKGCEKQYRPEEAELFKQLADYYHNQRMADDKRQLCDISALIVQDLDSGYPIANAAATAAADRGALRALVWGEKVTRILASILCRFEKQQDSILENTNIYVCEICGFVYIGDEPPEICPVCKVPNMKIRRIEKEAV